MPTDVNNRTRTAKRDWDGVICLLCEKPFQDGSAARATRGGVRILTTIGWFRGWACSPCITRLHAMQIAEVEPDGTVAWTAESEYPPFTAFEDFGRMVEEYRNSDEFAARAKLNEVLRRTAKPSANTDGNDNNADNNADNNVPTLKGVPAWG